MATWGGSPTVGTNRLQQALMPASGTYNGPAGGLSGVGGAGNRGGLAMPGNALSPPSTWGQKVDPNAGAWTNTGGQASWGGPNERRWQEMSTPGATMADPHRTATSTGGGADWTQQAAAPAWQQELKGFDWSEGQQGANAQKLVAMKGQYGLTDDQIAQALGGHFSGQQIGDFLSRGGANSYGGAQWFQDRNNAATFRDPNMGGAIRDGDSFVQEIRGPGSYQGQDNYTPGEVQEYWRYKALPGHGGNAEGNPAKYNGQQYERIDPKTGQVIGTGTFSGLGDGMTWQQGLMMLAGTALGANALAGNLPGMTPNPMPGGTVPPGMEGVLPPTAPPGGSVPGGSGVPGAPGNNPSAYTPPGSTPPAGTPPGSLDLGPPNAGPEGPIPPPGSQSPNLGPPNYSDAGPMPPEGPAPNNPGPGPAAPPTNTVGGPPGAETPGGPPGGPTTGATPPGHINIPGIGNVPWSAIAPFIGGAMSANASKDAAESQERAAKEGRDLFERIYNDQKAMQEPWRKAGGQAIGSMADFLGLTENRDAAGYGDFMREFSRADFEADPGYQFRKEEGEKAIARAMSSRGKYDSGQALKEIARFGQGIASDEFDRAYGRFNTNKTTKFNRLASVAGVGQTAASQTGQQAGQMGQNVANTLAAGANARAAGTVGSANAWGNALGQSMDIYQNAPLYDAYYRRLTA